MRVPVRPGHGPRARLWLPWRRRWQSPRPVVRRTAWRLAANLAPHAATVGNIVRVTCGGRRMRLLAHDARVRHRHVVDANIALLQHGAMRTDAAERENVGREGARLPTGAKRLDRGGHGGGVIRPRERHMRLEAIEHIW